MTTTLEAPPVEAKPVPADALDESPKPRRWWVAWPIGLLKFLAGVFCCQSWLLSILVVGWTHRRMRRAVLRSWGDPSHASGKSGVLASLWDCAKRGVPAAMNVFVATLPATGLWYYAWVLGWNVSFHKQYEQSHLGASLGLFGVFLFAAVMLYVPMAVARQAVTGDWRAFWKLGANWRLVRLAAPWQFVWAMGFALAAGVFMVVRIAPYFAGGSEEFRSLTDAQLLEWLKSYYLWTGVLLLLAYGALWMSAARTYARAVVRYARSGADGGLLNPVEAGAMRRRSLTDATLFGDNRRGGLLGVLTRAVERLSATAALAATFLVWITVAAQVFVAQFFHYVPGQGWLNHPLVLLPWMRYLPPGLVD